MNKAQMLATVEKLAKHADSIPTPAGHKIRMLLLGLNQVISEEHADEEPKKIEGNPVEIQAK